jgi:radical SAM protein with 4Fe4S-binding SPASM domain
MENKKDYLDILDFTCKTLKNLVFIYFDDIDKDILGVLSKYGYSSMTGTINSRCGLLYKVKHHRGYGFCEMRYMHRHVVLPDGSVSLCCMDFGLQHVLGNLLNVDYNDLHEGGEWEKLRRSQKELDNNILCRNCEFFVPFLNPRFFVYLITNLLNKLGYNYYQGRS